MIQIIKKYSIWRNCTKDYKSIRVVYIPRINGAIISIFIIILLIIKAVFYKNVLFINVKNK